MAVERLKGSENICALAKELSVIRMNDKGIVTINEERSGAALARRMGGSRSDKLIAFATTGLTMARSTSGLERRTQAALGGGESGQFI
jgi:hypothetical protein